ncbi:hypothetical protein [Pseudomonas chlororaphis]|uniref:Uncharacterized protein n=1 Tax=Pseudomonas chlororaphis TaxID=587753 RepID=A0AAX3FWJ1_9PSED|nr:hypothetical protein [Pseudomonas chlororaphis]AZC39386.1 hypothetical protein C4K37_5021 [Pseudomonas chlororaphis subsp. piscium]AZC45937.1 hypothetical protein C4K36_5034 [Pseudomonas chlororaphis subsp. piscium]WDG71472.1 hypothetical protein PUP65_25700 [Pseudomonas chlororaphis]WDH30744.1 hypothetical protein PUP81_08620 [Pseudomonas chlororaphis]WDH69998.1 hypothetical protein PUP78_25685 [Pseudomonas chlororaphis]
MAKPSITEARGITPEVMQKLNQYRSSKDLRGIQTKLTGTARELRKLSNGWSTASGLLGRLGEHLTAEQRQLLNDAAHLIDSVNTQVEHAKEKHVRSEKASKRRQDARNARAKQLIAVGYPFPTDSMGDLLALLKTALIFNRARVFQPFYSPNELNHRYRDYLQTPTRLIGWKSVTDYRASHLSSLRWDLVGQLTSDIAYDDGSEVEDRLKALQAKISEVQTNAQLTTNEQETIRLWTEALAPESKSEGQV